MYNFIYLILLTLLFWLKCMIYFISELNELNNETLILTEKDLNIDYLHNCSDPLLMCGNVSDSLLFYFNSSHFYIFLVHFPYFYGLLFVNVHLSSTKMLPMSNLWFY
uniref:Uncharacterized protein n=1 Tax=Cacopsylla melanoneura TaxID=428564 RepID=A0A8D8LEV0_9HEMI